MDKGVGWVQSTSTLAGYERVDCVFGSPSDGEAIVQLGAIVSDTESVPRATAADAVVADKASASAIAHERVLRARTAPPSKFSAEGATGPAAGQSRWPECLPLSQFGAVRGGDCGRSGNLHESPPPSELSNGLADLIEGGR